MPKHFVLEVEEENNVVAVIVTKGQDITSEELPKIKLALRDHFDEDVEAIELPVINKNFVYVGKASTEGVETIDTFTYTLSPVEVY